MTLKLTDPSPQMWGENLPFWFLALARFGSLFLMLSGLVYWADMLGVFGQSGLERGPWQQIAVRVVLSCSFLIASVGVWQLTFWGVVMWGLSAITQTIAIALIPDFVSEQSLFMLAHLLGLILLLASTSWIYFRASKTVE